MSNKEKIKKGIYFKFYESDFQRLEYIIKVSGKCKTALIRELLLKEFLKIKKKNND
jgi:hypothetical protein